MITYTKIQFFFFIEVPVPSQESEWSRICVLGLSILPLSMIFQLDFGIVFGQCVIFVFFIFFSNHENCNQ